jgi:hypothetical protein
MNTALLPARKPSLLDLWIYHRFDVARLATLAGVEVDTVQAMLCYYPVSSRDAEAVLDRLGRLVKKSYTLECVYVVL